MCGAGKWAAGAPACPSLTSFWVEESSPARSCSWAASRGSESPRCCCSAPPGSRPRASPLCTSRARSRPSRSVCGPTAWGGRTTPVASPCSARRGSRLSFTTPPPWVPAFRMPGAGLEPVPDPAAAFLGARVTGVSGSAVTALMEGTRPMLVEIQALATKAGFGTPQRVATGLDHRRLALLLAVLERRGDLPFGSLDVFVNVTGGVRLVEPSTDLAVLAALVSTVHDRPVPADALFLGEVGLGGEIRPVAGVERRLAEAARQGFRRVVLSNRSTGSAGGLEVIGLEGIGELARRLAA